MTLENINCPQFVDFTSKDTFNINDGADFCFDQGVVGELIDLGSFSNFKITDEPVTIKTFHQSPLTLKDATNLSHNNNNLIIDKKLTPKSKQENVIIKEKLPIKNDENKPNFVQKTFAKMGAVLMIKQNKPPLDKPKTVLTENIPPKPLNQHNSKLKKPLGDPKVIRAPPLDLNRVRTYSKNETLIIDVPNKDSRQSRSRHLPKQQPVSQTNVSSLMQRPNSADRSKAPLPIYQGIKFVPKLKMNTSRNSSVKSSVENLDEILKSRPASLNRGFSRNVSSTPNKIGNIANMSSNGSLNGSKIRTGSNTSGLLHTELRAYKRIEYERFQKEKEKIASMIKKDLETSRIQNEKEEIKRMRSNSIVRSNPIRHYKPMIVKPSSKPLTNPISPNLSARSFCYH
ncbi:unnamed protein product [Brachionus calyciflorus]|uniref:TPX2 C-terminal domain-containing protein n=1 Tax=Brachionus calyciflorus TaxID=104777 RepID=A0A814D801_9BILA|nr:unnamed protein product [Brachionus calyciflorus]